MLELDDTLHAYALCEQHHTYACECSRDKTHPWGVHVEAVYKLQHWGQEDINAEHLWVSEGSYVFLSMAMFFYLPVDE